MDPNLSVTWSWFMVSLGVTANTLTAASEGSRLKGYLSDLSHTLSSKSWLLAEGLLLTMWTSRKLPEWAHGRWWDSLYRGPRREPSGSLSVFFDPPQRPPSPMFVTPWRSYRWSPIHISMRMSGGENHLGDSQPHTCGINNEASMPTHDWVLNCESHLESICFEGLD